MCPLIALWHDDVLYVRTGLQERNARNLATNSRCAVTTGRNDLDSGLDIVVEGEAVECPARASWPMTVFGFGKGAYS